MLRSFVLLAGLFLGGALSEPGWAADPAPAPDPAREAELLTHVRQLTFEGRRAGEGYFSPDGAKLVFQSEREPGNPFFQIYVLDLASGETRRISPGVGKTTCSYFRPGTGEILFASTHHDPRSRDLQAAELAQRASGKERRYSWDFDPEMELYVGAPSGELTRLTHVAGYDAEGSYAPDGQSIVFSSTRQAYGRELSDAERQQLEADPSFFADLWLMRADGGSPRRLTDVDGYDGGPFFTHDGKFIVWRRFDTRGLTADVWAMRADGTEPRRLTDFGAMSWAPYPHPSGQYLIFTSNKLGFDNFELYLVDFEGRKEPVRVTYSAGFDGLPVPAPDGKHLSWTSTRRGGQGQIMLADWNHERAVALLRDAPLRVAAGSPR
jgi:Tol biopolymer transport system component